MCPCDPFLEEASCSPNEILSFQKKKKERERRKPKAANPVGRGNEFISLSLLHRCAPQAKLSSQTPRDSSCSLHLPPRVSGTRTRAHTHTHTFLGTNIKYYSCLISIFFFFLAAPRHTEFPGQGSNWSCGCHLCHGGGKLDP